MKHKNIATENAEYNIMQLRKRGCKIKKLFIAKSPNNKWGVHVELSNCDISFFKLTTCNTEQQARNVLSTINNHPFYTKV